jgi:hypothetical protein
MERTRPGSGGKEEKKLTGGLFGIFRNIPFYGFGIQDLDLLGRSPSEHIIRVYRGLYSRFYRSRNTVAVFPRAALRASLVVPLNPQTLKPV